MELNTFKITILDGAEDLFAAHLELTNAKSNKDGTTTYEAKQLSSFDGAALDKLYGFGIWKSR